jgi:hypothetical protein
MPIGGSRSRRFFIRCLLVSAAGVVFCLVGAFVILTLQSPRVGMVQPWFGAALDALAALLLFFSALLLAFKFLAQSSDGSGDSSE